ncbi:MAG: hypothetical protein NTY01_09275 [Verrucomicrobia bacterium]|nr:hypothetical protein [Verrucomicrobiota bacterium]
MNTDPARRSKIARLPFEIRKELNLRLRKNESGKKLVVWLNGLPQMKTIVAQPEFKGEPVTGQNLSEWRRGGYQDWLRKEERLEQWQEKSKFALDATGGNAEEAANVIVALDVAEVLTGFDPELLKDRLKESPETFLDLINAWSNMQRTTTAKKVAAVAEVQGAAKIEQGERKLNIEEQRLVLARLSTAEKFLEFYNNEDAKRICTGNGSNSEKIAAMGQLMFGEHWDRALKQQQAAEEAAAK